MTAACVSPVLLADSLPDFPAADPGAADLLSQPRLKVPSERDLEVYEQVVVARMSQREVAEIHEISQPRVHQVLREMAAWVADNTPGFAAGLSPQQKLRLMHYNVTRQLEHQKECLMEAWRESIGEEFVRRTSKEGGRVRTLEIQRPTRGDARYLREAGRLSLQMLKAAGWSPGVAVPDAPQDSPYWQMAEEEKEMGDRRQGTDEEIALSTFDAPARKPQRTSAELDVVTAKREAVYAAPKLPTEQPCDNDRQLENTLSLGTGPLLPTDSDHGTRRPGSRRERNKGLQRQAFLRGEQPPTSVKEAIRQSFRLAEG